VVHRDIKPENIMLRGHHALVTDFGVAKAVSEATGRQTLTTAGVALGTPAYMAPEQASADPHLDHRVDIYALGAVAYELLTGRPVFMGTTPQMVLSAHVTEAPVPMTKYRETVPRALEALVMRCLEKQPADRWQSAEELLPQLEALATPSGGITPTQTQPTTGFVARKHRILVAVPVAVAVVVIGLLALQVLRGRPLNITVSDIRPVTSEPGVEYQPAIAPDGKEVAFVAGIGAPHLVIRGTLSGGSAVPGDTALRTEAFPEWSPDGDYVRFYGCRATGCAWEETGRLGGIVRPARLPQRAVAQPAWSPDGTRVAFVDRDTIFTASTVDGVVHQLAIHKEGYHSLHSLVWSPDGKLIAYVNGNVAWRYSGNVMGSSIWILDAAGGVPRPVTTSDFLNVSPAWLDARHLLFVSNREGPRGMFAVEVGTGGARGEPRGVSGVADPHSISYSATAHQLAWAKLTLRQNVWSYALGRSGPTSIRDGRPVTSGAQVVETHDVSPDGRWLLYDSNLRGNMDLYRVALSGGEAVRLTEGSEDEWYPRWSPDGGEIAYYAATRAGSQQTEVRVVPANGGAAVAVSHRLENAENPQWSPDGRRLALASDQTGRLDVWTVSRDSVGGPWHEATQLTDFGCFPADWAPDGSGVLCTSGPVLWSISPEGKVLWRYELASVNHLTLVGSTAGFTARFSRDGATLFLGAVHEDGRRGIWAIPAKGGPARLVIAFDDPNLVAAFGGVVSVGRDQLYLTVSEYESDIWAAKLKW
jgi:eukaryotic-like serine/threonine-protein kinase